MSIGNCNNFHFFLFLLSTPVKIEKPFSFFKTMGLPQNPLTVTKKGELAMLPVHLFSVIYEVFFVSPCCLSSSVTHTVRTYPIKESHMTLYLTFKACTRNLIDMINRFHFNIKYSAAVIAKEVIVRHGITIKPVTSILAIQLGNLTLLCQ